MLYINDVIEMSSDKVQYRIVYLNPRENIAWLFPLFGKNPKPLFSQVTELEKELKNRKFKFIPGLSGEIHAKPTEKAIRDRDVAFERIKPLIESAPQIFIPAERNLLINNRAQEIACSPRTLLNSLRLYWGGGQTRNALLPNYHKRGSSNTLTCGRGRPPKYEDRDIYQLTEADKAIFTKIIESKYLKGKTATIQGTFDLMERAHYSVVNSEGELIELAPGEGPTIGQFRHFFKSRYSPEAVIRAREGDAVFDLNHAAKLGDAELSVYTAGDNFEIDATIADVFLVFSQNLMRIVGKPTIYLIVDSKTWLITGFYIGFEHPSWPAALQAVVSIAEDKDAICNSYGIPYDPADWPATGVLPKQFTADRGSDVISRDSTRLVDCLEVDVRNLPSKQAKRKPHVECSFKLIQRPMSEHVAGYEPPENAMKRQGKHYDKDACLTLDQFIAIIIKAIIKTNNSPRPNYPLTPQQTLDGLIPTPINLWNYEIRTRAGALSRYSEEFIRNALLPKETATVTLEGISFKDCLYTCTEAVKRGWFERARRGAFKVTVTFDRRLADEILVHDELNPGKTFVASLSEKSACYRGMSFQEIEAIQFERKRLNKHGEQVTKRQKFKYHATVDPIVQEATAELKKFPKSVSRSARKKDIREDRAAELSLERQQKAKLGPKNTQQPTADVVHLPAPKPTTDTHPNQRNSRLMAQLNGTD